MTTLAELLRDPEASAELMRRCVGDAGIPMAPPFQLKPVRDKWPVQDGGTTQRHVTAPAAKERKEGAVQRHKEKQ